MCLTATCCCRVCTDGAGKSSIFRCLGGLWKIPQGKITRPGGATGSSGQNQVVFYIPQRPYNVLGTLCDQMTYPDTTGAEDLTKEKLIEVLSQVDLEHLVEREGALTVRSAAGFSPRHRAVKTPPFPSSLMPISRLFHAYFTRGCGFLRMPAG